MESLIKYNSVLKSEVLNIFDSNVPDFFDPTEREHFKAFLSRELDNYYILSSMGKIVGAGGYWAETRSEARICWLMIHSDYHSKGFGKLMMSRFQDLVIAEGTYTKLSLKTAQKTEMFYKKLGYATTYSEKDYWAKGLDLLLMEKNC